ncbi:FtsX-like permease family protein [Cellulosilyticum ruminicola]|uniref:FtsX-like permease family protein n=1 Tax=Cellulosilyticum ruminicola TaxID=425254 RepID=UPI0006D10F1A|nr:ABC transporter permease [Cellulosilyticum ruminicola]
MYFKLSMKNMQKSFKDYAIYFLTLIFGVCIFYTFNSIGSQSAMFKLSSAKNEMVQNLVLVMQPISVVVSVILAYLIVYANNFLIRRRKKEFGLYQTLGMGKWHIAQILSFETLIVGILSLGVGLLIGVIVSQGVSVVIAYMFQADLRDYTFTFSNDACIKTCIYFAIMYLLALVFNMITISRYKLIDLLTAGQKNETLKVRNPYITLMLFILAIGLIGTAYYLLIGAGALRGGSLTTMSVMFITGALGTYFLFASLSGFLLRMVQMNKKLYLKDLNMFVLRQFNSRINTTTVSITIISLMLLLTIGIMSSALSIIGTFNQDLSTNNLTDFSALAYVEDEKDRDKEQPYSILAHFEAEGFDYNDLFENIVEYGNYHVERQEATLTQLMGKEAIDKVLAQYGGAVNFNEDYLPTILESDYNKLMELYGKQDQKIELEPNEYAVVCNFNGLLEYVNAGLKAGHTLDYGTGKLVPKYDTAIDMPLSNTNTDSELGTVIIDDSLFNDSFKQEAAYICANYKKAGQTVEQAEEHVRAEIKKFYEEKVKPYDYMYTKLQMEASSVGISAMMAFIGLYLGMIFSITSAAILAIRQLSEASDNKVRYNVLRKIGVDEKMINFSLLLQIGLYFMFPLAVAIIHSIVGLTEINKMIVLFGHINIAKNIFFTAVFLILIYGMYFIATYLGSKNIIKEPERRK